MTARRSPKQGDVFWLDRCAPLGGGKPKGRPVIVLDSNESTLGGESVLLVVAASSSATESSAPDRIELPWGPRASSGLRRQCWVVPAWYGVVERESLQDLVGTLSTKMMNRIVAAVMARIDDADRLPRL